MFALPVLAGDGVYAFRLDQPHEQPVYATVNLPEIWWTLAESSGANPGIEGRLEVDSASAGERLRLFGRCLTFGGRAGSVSLISQAGRNISLKSTNQGPYELIADVPQDLVPGSYSLEVRPPTGGSTVASAHRVIQIRAADETHLANLSLADFGAKADSHFDKFDNISAFWESRGSGRGKTKNPRRRLLPVGAHRAPPKRISRWRVRGSDRALFPGCRSRTSRLG